MQSSEKLPGYWSFLWLFWMQPISLHRRLVSIGIDEPNAPVWRLLAEGNKGLATRRAYVLRMASQLVFLTPTVVASVMVGASILRLEVDWVGAAAVVALGVALGVALALALGVALGVAYGVALGVVAGVVYGVTFGSVFLSAAGAAVGIALGVASGATVAVAESVALGVGGGVARGAAYGVVLGVAWGVTVGPDEFFGVILTLIAGVILGVSGGVAMILSVFRTPLWLVEALLQTLLFIRQRLLGTQNLDTSPVFWHELSYIPLPFLARHIELTAESDVRLARRALNACLVTPGQRGIGHRALERLQGREIEKIATGHQFKRFVDADTDWLPPEEAADSETSQLRQVARYIVAASASSFPQHRLDHLESARKGLDGVEVQLLTRRSTLVTALSRAIPSWRHALSVLQNEAASEASELLPVPFRAGKPLDPEEGREVFRGREASIREIESHLALANDARSVLLLGPRRTGKSSLLKMLPTLLPDAVCVFFDLQGHPVDTPQGFFRALAEETRRQARRTRQLELPALGEGSAFEAASEWLQALEDVLGERRLLICLDEFEVLENSFGGERRDLLRLMGLLRSTIQHRRRVRLLIAGEAPFDELDGMWDAHFVSVREVRLGHLAPEVAKDLVRKPTETFPDDAIPEPVADRLVKRTGAQPFLLQLYAQTLVARLNTAGRRQATPEDLDPVEEEVLGQVGSYFRDIWNRAPAEAQDVLEALARKQTIPDVGKKARRWLERRCLFETHPNRLTIPIFGRFLLEEVLD